MSDTTARLGIVIPEGSDAAVIGVVNDAFDAFDAAMNCIVLAQLADASDIYNGMWVFALDTQRLYLRVASEWLMVAVADNTNNDKVTLPGGSFTALTDDTGGFQLGADSGSNMQFTSSKIQSRNNNAADTMRINPLGGDVIIGEEDGDSGGLTLEYMRAREDMDNTEVTVASTDWTTGENSADISEFPAPPSGRVMVIVSCQYNLPTADDDGYLGFRISSGGDEILAPGSADGRFARMAGNIRGVATVVDIVNGLEPGDNHRYQSAHKKGSGDDYIMAWRKIIVQPMF